MSDSVAIVSGGLDSTTLVYDMLQRGLVPHMISFNYGQRHKKELEYAKYTARRLQLKHDVIDLSGLTPLISNSALTSGNDIIDVPEGHYAEENMSATVVPNRNMIMVSIAAAIAVNEKADTIGIGVHAGDHFVYPDCRPPFISLMEQAILTANDGFHVLNPATMRTTPGYHIAGDRQVEYETAARNLNMLVDSTEEIGTIYAPFLNKSKADIAERALLLDVPLHDTWSCYKGGEYHCGRCGTCVERLEAIDEAQARLSEKYIRYQEDETVYADSEYWREAIAARNTEAK
jgi:7-cyano-7-deazaguanine synthase